MNLPSASSKDSTGPRNGKREIVTVDSDPDDVIDEDFSGSPGKKTKVEGETTAGDSMYDWLPRSRSRPFSTTGYYKTGWYTLLIHVCCLLIITY